LTIATALLALTAVSYGQAGDDMKKAADDTGSATKRPLEDGACHQEGRREDGGRDGNRCQGTLDTPPRPPP